MLLKLENLLYANFRWHTTVFWSPDKLRPKIKQFTIADRAHDDRTLGRQADRKAGNNSNPQVALVT